MSGVRNRESEKAVFGLLCSRDRQTACRDIRLYFVQQVVLQFLRINAVIPRALFQKQGRQHDHSSARGDFALVL